MATNIWDGSAADNAWDTAANWSLGTQPADTEDIRIPADATSDIGGYDTTEGGTIGFNSFIIEEGCTINIGSRTASATTSLQVDLNHTAADHDMHIGGTGTYYLDIDNAANLFIHEAGSSKGEGEWDCNIVGTANHDLFITADENQKIGIAPNSGDTAEFDEIHVLGGATVEIGSGVVKTGPAAIDKLAIDGGLVDCRSALVTIDKKSGTLTHWTGAVTTLNENSGQTKYNSTGTLGTANISGELDCSDNPGATITQANMYAGATYRDPNKKITNTNGIDLVQCGIEDVTLDVGKHVSLARTAV